MTKKGKYACGALVCYISSFMLLLYWICVCGIFTKDKIVIKTLATTGPDYEIALGQMKMAMQMPAPILRESLWGIMVAEGEDKIGKFIDEDWMSMYDYFVVTVEVVGAKQSDSISFHPLVKVKDCKRIDYVALWGSILIGSILFFLFLIFSIRYSFMK